MRWRNINQLTGEERDHHNHPVDIVGQIRPDIFAVRCVDHGTEWFAHVDELARDDTTAVFELAGGQTYTVEKVMLEMVTNDPRRATDPQHGDGLYFLIKTHGGRSFAFCHTDEEIRAFAPDLADYLEQEAMAS